MSRSSVRVTIGGREIEVSRARLGLFLQLERHLLDLREAILARNSGEVVHAVKLYLETATGMNLDLAGLPWYEFYQAFIVIRQLNSLTREIPMLRGAGFKRRDVAPWDHPWRPLILWIHLIASTYGWSRTEIEDLWPEDAAIYVQEILTDEQLRREWEYQLSPVAHPTDKKGKDLFKPLRRPSWMSPRPRKQRLLKKLLPAGTIIDISGVKSEDLDD